MARSAGEDRPSDPLDYERRPPVRAQLVPYGSAYVVFPSLGRR